MANAAISWIAVNKSGEISLDSDLPPLPRGWERCLDLQSGVMYLKQMNPQPGAEATHSHKKQRVLLGNDDGEGDPALQLTLSLTTPTSAQSNRSSLCDANSAITNSGLKFLAVPNYREDGGASFNGSSSPSQNGSSSSSSSSPPSQQKQLGCQRSNLGLRGNNDSSNQEKGVMKAAGCPHCFMYVLPSKSNPRCPRCKSSILVDLSPLTIH